MIHDAFAGALFHPRRQLVLSAREQPIGTAFLAFLLAGFSWVLSDFLVHGVNRVPVSLFIEGVVFLGLLALSLGLGMTLVHFFAELLGGKGNITGLFWGFFQSTAPLALLVPLAIVSMTLGTMSGTIYLPGKLAIFAWVFASQVVAISEACAVSVPRACFTLLLAYGTGLIGFFLLSVLVPLAILSKIGLILNTI